MMLDDLEVRQNKQNCFHQSGHCCRHLASMVFVIFREYGLLCIDFTSHQQLRSYEYRTSVSRLEKRGIEPKTSGSQGE